MSGGYFDYQQYTIQDIASSIEEYIYGEKIEECDIKDYLEDPWLSDKEKEYIKENHRTLPNKYDYSERTLNKMKEGLEIIKQAHIYSQRIDWLLSGDDGEDSFMERLKEELHK